MAKFIRKPHQQKGVIEEYFEKVKGEATVKDLDNDGCFLISFKHFDRKQSPSFADWQDVAMLADGMDALSSYCNKPLLEQCDGKKFTIYGDFPPKSKYTHPIHVPPDANWARIHVNGVYIIAGHIYKNVFYVVFMDNEHQFWITEK